MRADPPSELAVRRPSATGVTPGGGDDAGVRAVASTSRRVVDRSDQHRRGRPCWSSPPWLLCRLVFGTPRRLAPAPTTRRHHSAPRSSTRRSSSRRRRSSRPPRQRQGPDRRRHPGAAGAAAGQPRPRPVHRHRHRPGDRQAMLWNKDSTAPQIPASTAKLLTGAAAAHLGRPDQPVRHQGGPAATRRATSCWSAAATSRCPRATRASATVYDGAPLMSRPRRPGQGQRHRRQADRAGHRVLVRARPGRRLADRRHPRHPGERPGLHHPDVRR